MEKTLPLYLGPSVIGSVVCREEDSRIVLTAKTYASLHGICRAYVRGNGGRLLIGVLSPDETFFSAEKSVTKTSLYAEGLSFDGITYAYAVTSSKKHKRDITDWKKIDVLSDALCHDSAISALAKSTDALCDSSFSPTRLAVPLLTGRPFPRPDVLCLLTPQEINGTLYGVLGISRGGSPRRI
ncbi:MAG: hypothetical protein IJB42_06685 [Oscillospiraceae bacterium]|nr:hypothetical protein [Oscillospiraceae bacterium]MBQ3225381.1 hypothetical protein [Oscillospiraceae bacterium]